MYQVGTYLQVPTGSGVVVPSAWGFEEDQAVKGVFPTHRKHSVLSLRDYYSLLEGKEHASVQTNKVERKLAGPNLAFFSSLAHRTRTRTHTNTHARARTHTH